MRQHLRFENFLGKMKSTIHTGTKPLAQIVNRYCTAWGRMQDDKNTVLGGGGVNYLSGISNPLIKRFQLSDGINLEKLNTILS